MNHAGEGTALSHQHSTHESMAIEAASLSHIIEQGERVSKGATHSQGGGGNQLVEEEAET
jgi:hypothetical protein